VNQEVHQPAEADVEEITGRVGLMDARVEPANCESEVDGIEVVKSPAPKGETADGDGAGQQT